jgi:undecaprenyl-diphosphatase
MELLYYLFLFLFAFLESLINPFPVDLFIIYLIKKEYNFLLTVLVALIGNVLGALLAYQIGLKIKKEKKLESFLEKLKLNYFIKVYEKKKDFLLFFSTFTPLPYKVFTYLSGYFEMNLFLFVFYSIIGRGARYLTVAFIANSLTIKQIIILALILFPVYILTEKILSKKLY